MRLLIVLLALLLLPTLAIADITTDLEAQWDVNTRGRTDNDLYEHVNGVAETSTNGSVASSDDGTEDVYHYDGTGDWTVVSTWPAGLSTTFADSDYTLAARFKLDTVNPGAFQSVFGTFKDGDSALRIHLATETGNGQALGAQVAAGTDAFLDSATDVDDGAYHVLVQRRSGNEFSLWLDGVEVDTQTVAVGTAGTLDRFGFGARTDGAPDWPFDGRITWGAVWDRALSDSDIGELDDATNPFVSGPTVTLSDATPDIDTTVTATLSGAFGAGGNPATVTFASGDTVSCSIATSTTCDFPLNFSALVASGDLGTTKVESATTITVTNGTETSQSTAINIQIPASGYDIVDLTCTAGTDCSDDSEAISPMIAGDDCAIKVTSGTLDHLSTECAPVFSTSSFSYIVARYDESATAWLGQETVNVVAPVTCMNTVASVVQPSVRESVKSQTCAVERAGQQ